MVSPRKKILVAEADEIVLTLISHVLHRQGYAVDVATTAGEAAARLAANRYDVALLNVTLPGADAKWLRDVFAAIPSLVIASDSLGTDLQARAVIRKPIEFNELIITLSRIFE